MRHAGKKPESGKPETAQEAAEQQVYSLMIAVANKDLAMLEELWGTITPWDQTHFVKLVETLVAERWQQGLTSILKSYTTDVVFNSQSLNLQASIMSEIFKMKHTCTDKEVSKAFEDCLTQKPFTIISVYTALENNKDYGMSVTDIKSFVERAHLGISEFEYGHLKFSTLNTLLR